MTSYVSKDSLPWHRLRFQKRAKDIHGLVATSRYVETDEVVYIPSHCQMTSSVTGQDWQCRKSFVSSDEQV